MKYEEEKLAKLVWANHPVVVGTSLAVFQAVILVIINDDDDDDNYDDDYDDDDNYDDDVDKDGDDGLPYHKGTSLLSFQHSCRLHNSVWPNMEKKLMMVIMLMIDTDDYYDEDYDNDDEGTPVSFSVQTLESLAGLLQSHSQRASTST